MINDELKKAVVQDAKDTYNKPIKPVPAPEHEIGIDLSNALLHNIADSAEMEASTFDANVLNSFTQVAQSRDQLYQVLDDMSNDTTLSAVLETYAEDATETNDRGNIVWCESEDPEVAGFVTYLLNALNVDKNAYTWVHHLCKYGDLYLRLYRESDYEDLLFDRKKDDDKRRSLNEDIKLRYYGKNDNYVHYLEMAPNPAEVFELTRFGKTAAYIVADVQSIANSWVNTSQTSVSLNKYNFYKKDINLFPPTEWVHASLEDNSSRIPEEVDLFISDDKKLTYKVKRGQSLLYNSYKVWRQLMLLENSVLLQRVSGSSIVRVIGVEVGDMPKENVQPHLMSIKQLIEQRAALDVGNSMSEYTNPGPVVNNVYIPTRNQQGVLTSTQIGGDVNIGELTDLDYYTNKLFGGLRVPKQFFNCLRGDTELLLLNGKRITIKELFEDRTEYIGKGIMACNTDGSLQPTVITDIMLTQSEARFIRIHLDNGKHVDVTSNHKMMLRDGTFITAGEVEVGMSFMPYYEKMVDGRRHVLDNKTGKVRPQYRIVAESVCDIPPRYQVHHIDGTRLNDDFDNLIPLTVADHYATHFDLIHESARSANAHRKEIGEPHGNTGSRCATDGYSNMRLKPGEKIPEGYVLGMTRHTTEEEREAKRIQCGNRFRGCKPWSAGLDKTDPRVKRGVEKSAATRRAREAAGAYVESRKRQGRKISELSKLNKERRSEIHRNRHPENRQNRLHYMRCACCNTVCQKMCNLDYYNEYLNLDKLFYCSDECKKMDGAGKLARSYKLLQLANSDYEAYEELRCSGAYGRKDKFFKPETLQPKALVLDEYNPECNHQVVAIEYLDVVEPAYDINVAADCHTFALPCGIFVHNCTEDAAGFSGGQSLSIISSRYAKMVKRIQNTFIQALTDAINLILIDTHNDNYINKFTLRMQAPTTQEEIDRRDNIVNKVGMVRDIMDTLGDIETPSTKLKITKSLLSNVVNDNDVIQLLQEEIDALVAAENPEETPMETESPELSAEDTSGYGDYASTETDYGFSDSEPLNLDNDDTMSMPNYEVSDDEDLSLPSPGELDIGDVSDATNPELG